MAFEQDRKAKIEEWALSKGEPVDTYRLNCEFSIIAPFYWPAWCWIYTEAQAVPVD